MDPVQVVGNFTLCQEGVPTNITLEISRASVSEAVFSEISFVTESFATL